MCLFNRHAGQGAAFESGLDHFASLVPVPLDCEDVEYQGTTEEQSKSKCGLVGLVAHFGDFSMDSLSRF